jgi:hypothetical protein
LAITGANATLASSSQLQLHKVEARLVVVRVGFHRLLQLLQRAFEVALGNGVQRFLFNCHGFQLVGGGQMLVEEFLDLTFGQGAHETVNRLAVHEQHAGWDAADAERCGELLFLVGVDLDQLEAPGVSGLHFFQQRADHLARTAPRGPEIDQHGCVVRSFDNLGFKIGDGDVDHGERA